MSRSYAKKYMRKICSTRNSDQYFQQQYHQNARAKLRRILTTFEKTLNDEELDKLVNSNRDWSVKLASNWAWPSDGGTSFQGSKETIRAELERIFFGEIKYKYCTVSAYSDYEALQKGKNPSWHSWVDSLWLANVLPRDLKSKEELANWYKTHSETIVNFLYKLKLRK